MGLHSLGTILVYSPKSTFRRSAVAVVSVLAATGLRVSLNPLLGSRSQFLFHAFAVAVAAQYGGTICGLIATLLSILLTDFIFLGATKGFVALQPGEILAYTAFAIVSLFFSLFGGQRIKAEEELLRIRFNLETAQHIAGVCSWESNLFSQKLWWSAGTRNIFGVQEDMPLATKDFYGLVHPDDRERVRKLAIAAIQSKEPYNVEHRIVRIDGEVRYVHQTARLHCNDAGTPLSLIGSIQDITDRKRAEQEIRILRGLLPICSYCKRIRDDKSEGRWSEIETYVKHHSEANFSHSVCPECMDQFYGREADGSSPI